MNQALLRKLIDASAKAVIKHADELTALDQAIGDGDHGLNMKRGFEAVLADAGALAEKPLPEALKAIGTLLVMKIGGASGPLYGTLFLSLGKNLSPDPDLTGFAFAFTAAIDAVKARGKAEAGQKTMLDVLIPIQSELNVNGPDLLKRVKARAIEAAEATIPVKAQRGRASFLGDRSIGHMDPGARSSALITVTICDVIGGV